MKNILRSLRRRFGISAPKMTVRTHVAWYWRWLGMMLLGSISLALALWIYDAGRRFAGFDRSEIEQEVKTLRDSVVKLEAETALLRSASNASESRLKIEQSAQTQLAKQVKTLEEENRRLKEDLAFFENLGPATNKLSINRFTVQKDVLPGEYRYRLLVLLGGVARDRQFQGSLQLLVNVQSKGGNGMILVPEASNSDNPAFRLNFKYFQRVEGTFRVPEPAKIRSVQVRVMEQGSNQATATQSVDL
ncbi:MAG: DUF6776 family protein [Burkholderiales bacterium]